VELTLQPTTATIPSIYSALQTVHLFNCKSLRFCGKTTSHTNHTYTLIATIDLVRVTRTNAAVGINSKINLVYRPVLIKLQRCRMSLFYIMITDALIYGRQLQSTLPEDGFSVTDG
jgi:hypothetical protein